jgi:RNA polymerase sigma factor (sigma-70 family)
MQDFSDFYGAQKDRVFRVVLAAGGRHAVAEDAVAEAFARAFARWSTVRTHGNPSAWVMLTALNVQRSWWRRVRREVSQAVPDQMTDTGMTPEVPVHLRRSVAALPRRQREVLALRILGDLSPAETADLLGIAVGTVGVHLSRALTTLRRSAAGQASPHDDRFERFTGLGEADFRRVDA